MTVDREQLRRRLEWQQDEEGGDPFGLQEQVLALLAELEQAEDSTHMAKQNHQAWKERARKAEARLAKVPALVETLRVMASDGDDWAHTVATKALAEWERE